MNKDDIEHPEPGSLPTRISFVEQMGGSAGYYVRFKGVPEEKGGTIRKYIPILQYESQEEALEAAIEYRNRKAEELDLSLEPTRGPHTEEAREEMSKKKNRIGLRGLGLTLSRSSGTIYPVLTALWTGENGQESVTRSMTQRGIHRTVEALAPHLKTHIHSDLSEEEIVRRGARGTARLIVSLIQQADPQTPKRQRLSALLERWEAQNERDRELIEEVRGEEEA